MRHRSAGGARSTLDAIADGEQGQGEQNWAEDAGGCGYPDPRRGKRLVRAAEGERFQGDLPRGPGTSYGPALAGWRERRRDSTKCGSDLGVSVRGGCDGSGQVLGRCGYEVACGESPT